MPDNDVVPYDLMQIDVDGPDEVDTEFPELVDNSLLRRGELHNIVAATKVGKTQLCANLGLCIASGNQFLGFEVPEPQPVMHVAPELPRVRANALYRPLMNSLPESMRAAARANLRVLPREESLDFSLDRFMANISEFQPGLVVLDGFYIVFSEVDENNHREVNAIYKRLMRIASEQRTAFVIAHHVPKWAEHAKGVVGFAARGSGVFAAAVEGTWRLSRATHGIIRLDCEFRYRASLSLNLRREDNGRFAIALDAPAPTPSTATQRVQQGVQFLTHVHFPVERPQLAEQFMAHFGVGRSTAVVLQRSRPLFGIS